MKKPAIIKRDPAARHHNSEMRAEIDIENLPYTIQPKRPQQQQQQQQMESNVNHFNLISKPKQYKNVSF